MSQNTRCGENETDEINESDVYKNNMRGRDT